MVSRKEIFHQASEKLRQDFEELVLVPHRGAKGAEAEGLVRKFLSARLPRRFDVGAGFVIDANDRVSGQTDLIVFDSLHCPVYRASDTAAIYPADNVASVIEVKSSLDKAALHDGFEKTARITALAKSRGDGPLHAQTFACVFGFSSPLRPETLLEHYCENLVEFGLGRHPDLVAVLGSCVLMLVGRHPAVPEWVPVLAFEGMGGKAGEGAHIAGGLFRTGGETLDLFFRLLLANLSTFRAHTDFNWSGAISSRDMEIRYVTSHTEETDPERRQSKLRMYSAQAKAMLAQAGPPAADGVIILGPGSAHEEE